MAVCLHHASCVYVYVFVQLLVSLLILTSCEWCRLLDTEHTVDLWTALSDCMLTCLFSRSLSLDSCTCALGTVHFFLKLPYRLIVLFDFAGSQHAALFFTYRLYFCIKWLHRGLFDLCAYKLSWRFSELVTEIPARGLAWVRAAAARWKGPKSPARDVRRACLRRAVKV